jgi:uncharacterized protein (TIGR03118 family)
MKGHPTRVIVQPVRPSGGAMQVQSAAPSPSRVGNFGNGHIDAYNPTSGKFVNKMSNPHGQAIVIDGLWSLRVGSDTTGSANFGPNTVFFTAGPNGEQDGLFGTITSSP